LERFKIIFFNQDYISAVFLSLQQALVAVAVDFVQQVFPLAHFLDFFFFPLSAKAILVTNNAAVANKNTFFMFICLIEERKCRADIANCQGQTVKSY
jgi:hypothetical protein